MKQISFSKILVLGLRLCLITLLVLLSLAIRPASTQAAPPAGTVVAWGCEGDSNASQCAVPADLSGVIAVAAGAYHSLALKSDGSVVAWGCIDRYPYETSNYDQCSVPPGLSGVIAIAAGSYHSLALKNDGTVVAWGCGTNVNSGLSVDVGQCTVPAGLTGVIAISAGESQSLALKNDGSVVAWGCLYGADSGQCAVPNTALSGVIAVAAGFVHSLALKNDGSVIAWGCSSGNDFGQCNVPTPMPAVKAISTATYHNLALTNDGSVTAWGCINYYDTGACTVPSGLNGVTAVSAGFYHSLALKSDGTVVAWGCNSPNDFGQCTVPAGLNRVTAVAAGYFHNLALVSSVSTSLSVTPVSGVLNGSVNLSASLTAVGAGLANQSLSFSLNGTSVGNATTDATGLAILSNVSLSGIQVGEYPSGLQVSFAGQGSYIASSGSAALTVLYPFNGFFQPVDNLPTENTVKGGASVPVKFSLSGNQGLAIIASGYPTSKQVACSASTPVDAIEETTTSNSGLSYDLVTGQYTYVWKTAKSWAGTCRLFTLRLMDGTDHTALFKFN